MIKGLKNALHYVGFVFMLCSVILLINADTFKDMKECLIVIGVLATFYVFLMILLDEMENKK